MADIFISYTTKDRARIIPIVKALEKLRWTTFWDWNSIPVGKTWRQYVMEGLDEARSVLVLWSEKSINSDYVLEEAEHGKKNGILVPALIDDVHPPFGFGQIQAANLINWDRDIKSPGFVKLLEALESILGQAPRKTGTKSKAWQKRKVLEAPGSLSKKPVPKKTPPQQSNFESIFNPPDRLQEKIKSPTDNLLTPDRLKRLEERLKKK